MKNLYQAVDGQVFDNLEDAVAHERLLRNSQEATLRRNLATYVANKSRLKAGILRRDMQKLDAAWEEWRKEVAPLSKFSLHRYEEYQRIYDAILHLEEAAGKYWLDRRYLAEAKEMIPKLAAAISRIDKAKAAGQEISPDFYDEALLREVPRVIR